MFLHNKTFSKKNPYYSIRGLQNFHRQNCKKIAPSNPNCLEFGHYKVFWSSQGQKRTQDYCFDMESGKIARMEKLESGQQEMQEKTAQMMKMVTSLTKGKGITDDPSLQREPMS